MTDTDIDLEVAADFLELYKVFTKYFWGPRCSEYEPDCWCCKAWHRYDEERKAIDYSTT